MTKNRSSTPLTPAVLHILLALSTEERHGYGIMKEVESESHGKVKMGPGTLYGSLGRMMEAGLIRERDRLGSLSVSHQSAGRTNWWARLPTRKKKAAPEIRRRHVISTFVD